MSSLKMLRNERIKLSNLTSRNAYSASELLVGQNNSRMSRKINVIPGARKRICPHAGILINLMLSDINVHLHLVTLFGACNFTLLSQQL
jgi:hypothetical protein